MSWAAKTKIANALSVEGTELYSDAVTLKSDETAHVQITGDFPTVATDNLLIRVYTTLDASSETFDTTSVITELTLSKDTDPGAISFSINGVYKFRLGLIRSGSTDTITANAWVRTNGNYRDCSLDI